MEEQIGNTGSSENWMPFQNVRTSSSSTHICKHVCMSNVFASTGCQSSKHLQWIKTQRKDFWMFNKHYWHWFCFDYGGGISCVGFHYNRSLEPYAGRSTIANINNQSCKLGARHHSNPKCIWQQNRAQRDQLVIQSDSSFPDWKKCQNQLS